MTLPSADFPLLFSKRFPARGLDAAIASLDVKALATEYKRVLESPQSGRADFPHPALRHWSPPQRGPRGKSYFVRHTGLTPGDRMSNRQEERLARALWVLNPRWPWPGGGSLRLLDYQVPLKARQKDAGIGKIDLLGVTEVDEVGRFVVIELKIDHAGGGRGDSPMVALMEALRYAAILQLNLKDIASEANREEVQCPASPIELAPAIILLGTAEWWQSWITLKAAGSWKAPFVDLLNQIETQIGVSVRCMALTIGASEVNMGG